MNNPRLGQDIRRNFSILEQLNDNGQPLVYLDSAATTHKPKVVCKAIESFYTRYNANVHRGAHFLSTKATNAFEQARTTLAEFIGAPSEKQIIWTRGTTEAINLVANCWGQTNLNKGDVIVLSTLEHHANIVPWQLLAQRTGAVIKPIQLKDNLTLDLNHFQSLLELGPKIVALSHASNATGNINPVKSMIKAAKAAGAVTLIDGAQAVGHFAIDVTDLDCDFYAFSGHKMFGPTGIGVLYGKQALLEQMPPWQGGGEMIDKVSFSQTTFNDLPFKFEAGTPNIAGSLGLASAVRFIEQFNRSEIAQQEQKLFEQLYDWLNDHPQITLYSNRENNVGIASFNVMGEHHQDIGTLLDQQGIAVRTGHHCAMPLMESLNIKGTVRASLSIYNDEQDISRFIEAMQKVLELLEY